MTNNILTPLYDALYFEKTFEDLQG